MTAPSMPLDAAEHIARRFLADLERRDLATAGAALAPDAAITFPGGATRRSIEEIVAGSAARYRRVGKRFERFDTLQDGPDAIVYCFGTLHGVFADGEAFDGIRFIDRFVVRDGLIVRHDVWNDAAHARPPR
ncbi:nuclear transport factor 2 family protein [Salinarimonas sp. NSM]|uniref:nuclear transport factor 2 family protein n=1 Tax=Salinarimonas sp. NSM TaxID=3458003 RepID=UPI00403516F8